MRAAQQYASGRPSWGRGWSGGGGEEEEVEATATAVEKRVARCCRLFSPRFWPHLTAVAVSDIIILCFDALALGILLLAHLMPPAVLPKTRALPLKESGLFKEVLHYYEDRQLKKGLKTAETILKKFPEHGGTFLHLAMRCK